MTVAESTISRLLVSRSALLTHTWRTGSTAVDPTGTPTFSVTDANGTVVQSGNAAVVGAGSGQTTFTLAARSQLCRLSVAWTATVAGDTATEVDYITVVGARMFSLARVRQTQQGLNDVTKYPDDELERRRVQVEMEAEWICARSFVPQYARDVLDGSGTPDIVLREADVRKIRRAAVQQQPAGQFVDLTTQELAALVVLTDRTLRRTVIGTAWPAGTRNVIIEYEYGLDASPPSVEDAAMARQLNLITRPSSGIPDRAMSFQAAEGGTYRLSQPGPYNTGLPDVDAAYEAFSLRDGAGEGRMGRGSSMGRGTGGGETVVAPYSRTLEFSPQRNSLFHRP